MTTVPLNPFPAASLARPERVPLPLPLPLRVCPSVVSPGPLWAANGPQGFLERCLGRRSEGRKPPKVEPDTPEVVCTCQAVGGTCASLKFIWSV